MRNCGARDRLKSVSWHEADGGGELQARGQMQGWYRSERPRYVPKGWQRLGIIITWELPSTFKIFITSIIGSVRRELRNVPSLRRYS